MCFIKNNIDQLAKFQPKANKAIFLGYSTKSKDARVLNPCTRVIKEMFDITFVDNFVFQSEPVHITMHVMEFDAPPPDSSNRQIIYEVDFQSLFGDPETTLNSEIFHQWDLATFLVHHHPF